MVLIHHLLLSIICLQNLYTLFSFLKYPTPHLQLLCNVVFKIYPLKVGINADHLFQSHQYQVPPVASLLPATPLRSVVLRFAPQT